MVVFALGDNGNLRPGYVLVPFVLAGITASVHLLIRGRSYAWGISALAAPIIVVVALLLAMWYAANQ
jgi:hypothetical protein